MAGDFEWVGRSPLRVDTGDKIRGHAVYIDDMKPRGMLYGKVLRSKFPHARIRRIDTGRAGRLPGVKGVVTGMDLPFQHGEGILDKPFLARDKVRYIGEGVAAVAAVDEQTAENALALIAVEYEKLPPVFEPLDAVKPEAPVIHENLHAYDHSSHINPVKGTNICHQFNLQKGDIEKGFAESDFIFENTFRTPMMQHASLEPHGAICLIDDETQITLWANNDSPYRCRNEIARALHLPLNRIRIISAPNIGGNFGGKGGLQAEAFALALAWKVRNRPIKVIYTRAEELGASLVRHPCVIHLKTGVKRGGRILARQVTMHWATGAYAEKGPTVVEGGGVTAAGPYKIPNVRIDGYCVYTNRPIAGAMRGYGAPQACWAYEQQMDIIADRLGLDPLEIRINQVYEDGDVHANGQVLYSEGLKSCLQKVAEKMAWGRKPLGKDRGRGLACMEKAAGKTRSGSAAVVKVNEDGTVDLLSSTTEVGQGSTTVLCQIVAEELGIPLTRVRKASPDTAFTPYDTSTTASRSTFHMGNAVQMAARDAREKIIDLAAGVLEAKKADLLLREGKVFVAGSPQKSLSIAGILKARFGSSGSILGRGFYFPRPRPGTRPGSPPGKLFWLLGVHGVEVEVNRATGEVNVLKVYAAHDAGKAIHPSNCEGQAQGGISWGIGHAFFEELKFEKETLLNPTLLNYKIPTALDMPEMETEIVEYLHPDGPFGAKGIAEASNAPTPPAIANAVYNAVGVRITDLPITPEKILAALEEKAEKKQRAHPKSSGTPAR